MKRKQKLQTDLDEPLIWIYDPRYPAATKSQLTKDPLADFDRPMMVIDQKELAALRKNGNKIEFV